MREVFPGVFKEKGRLYTNNPKSARAVYGERIIRVKGLELREWDPHRSKLGAALVNGLKELPVKPGSNVLYLGIAEGTTASHVSDIVGEDGIVFGVDVAPKVMRKLLTVADVRPNIIPLLANAGKPADYAGELQGVEFDVIFEDVAHPDMSSFLIKNSEAFLKKGGKALIAIKSQCIDSSRPPQQVFKEERLKLEKHFKVLQEVSLEPFEGHHVLFYLEKL